MINKNATRYFSSNQERRVCEITSATRQSNSGAGEFQKGDCINRQASILIECKTVMQDKQSISIKKDWLDKLKQEAFTQRVSNNCLAFNFGPEQENYFIINEKLMKFLIEKLQEVE